MKISDDLKKDLKLYLGKEGIHFFKTLYKIHKTVMKLNKLKRYIYSHSVHFNEGMQVRNFLRGHEDSKNWLFDDIENNYVKVIESIIKD